MKFVVFAFPTPYQQLIESKKQKEENKTKKNHWYSMNVGRLYLLVTGSCTDATK